MENQKLSSAVQETYQQPIVSSVGVPLVTYYNQTQIGMVKQQSDSKISESTQGALLRRSGFQILEEQQGVFIKQELKMLEVLTGCQTENTFYVYPLKSNSVKRGRVLFKCQEKSKWCERNCLQGVCRPFQMTISTLRRGGEDQPDEYEPFLFLDRPCKCVCFCYNRPELFVTLIENGKSEYLGKVIDPFEWCDIETDLYDKDNMQTHTIHAGCCQLGILCRFPCESCQKVDFEVKTVSGEVVSTVQKVSAGCLKASCSDTDNFALNFPANASVAEKALFLSAVLLIDYSDFEMSGQRNGG